MSLIGARPAPVPVRRMAPRPAEIQASGDGSGHVGSARPCDAAMRAPGVLRLAGQVLSHPANEGRRIRQLGRAVHFQVRGRLLGKPTLVRLGGRSRMLVSVDSAAGVKAAYANPPDVLEWRVWRRLLRPGDLFVDVGANIGTYSVLAAELGAEVIAVEPNADNARRVRANLALNGHESDVREVVLTDTTKAVHFSTDQDSETTSLLPAARTW